MKASPAPDESTPPSTGVVVSRISRFARRIATPRCPRVSMTRSNPAGDAIGDVPKGRPSYLSRFEYLRMLVQDMTPSTDDRVRDR